LQTTQAFDGEPAALQAANRSYARDYPVATGTNMAGTDSIWFQDLVASVSARENKKDTGIIMVQIRTIMNPRTTTRITAGKTFVWMKERYRKN
jgi:hypothetical protein